MVKVQSIRTTNSPAPALTWVPVTGPDGHVRMEMRWHVEAKHGAPAAPGHRHAA